MNDTKKIFMKKGSCSQALCFLLSREFGTHNNTIERAADPFAGGVLLLGHQCGMLWGTTLAAGIESLKRFSDHNHARAAAIKASQRLLKSYEVRTGSGNCRDVCGYDFTKKTNLAIFMIKFILHINRDCLDLAEQWLPKATQAALDGLSEKIVYSMPPRSCASEVVKMSTTDTLDEVMVAGFAGGLGLSGMACGALAAAILIKTIEWMKNYPRKSSYNNPAAKSVLRSFLDMTDRRILCRDICGKSFVSIDEHSEFIDKGGCATIIQRLGHL